MKTIIFHVKTKTLKDLKRKKEYKIRNWNEFPSLGTYVIEFSTIEGKTLLAKGDKVEFIYSSDGIT